jgi:hypothetical protein
MTDEWRIWNGEYEKHPCKVRDGNGYIYAWPNAGLMMAMDKSGRYWQPSDNIEVQDASMGEWMEALRHGR